MCLDALHYVILLCLAKIFDIVVTLLGWRMVPTDACPLPSIKALTTCDPSRQWRKYERCCPLWKLLVLLREPVRRTISAFNHNCKHKRYGVRRRGSWTIRVRLLEQQAGSEEISEEWCSAGVGGQGGCEW